MSTLVWIVISIVIAIVVVAIGWRIIVCAKASKLLKEYKIQDELSLEEVIAYFKDSTRLDILRADKNKLAVAIKSDANENKQVTLCLFDKEKGELVMEPPCLRIYKIQSISTELENAFGDKEMLVLS